MIKHLIFALSLAMVPAMAQEDATAPQGKRQHAKAPQHAPRPMTPPPVSPVIRIASHQALLEKYDANKNGRIDKEEMDAIHKDIDARKDEVKAKVLAEFDKDGDGKLSKEERQAILESRKEKQDERKDKIEENKDKRDAKGRPEKGKGPEGRGPGPDGKGPRPNPEAACLLRAAHLALLEKYDANKDGKLDETERKAIHAAMKAEIDAKRTEHKAKREAN